MFCLAAIVKMNPRATQLMIMSSISDVSIRNTSPKQEKQRLAQECVQTQTYNDKSNATKSILEAFQAFKVWGS